MNVKYYKVVVMRGHMGSNYDHATMTFYEKAKDKKIFYFLTKCIINEKIIRTNNR